MLDRTDRRILSLLQSDGRIAGVELADKVGLSPTAVGDSPTFSANSTPAMRPSPWISDRMRRSVRSSTG